MLNSLLCLSLAVFHESRGEPERGQEAVAEVVLNRTEKRNKSVCQVVYEPNQFSWTKKQVVIPKDTKEWSACKQVAQKVLDGKPNHTNGAEYFYSKTIKVPHKATNLTRIGNHVFFNQD